MDKKHYKKKKKLADKTLNTTLNTPDSMALQDKRALGLLQVDLSRCNTMLSFWFKIKDTL